MKTILKVFCAVVLVAFANCSTPPPETTQMPDPGVPNRDGGATLRDSNAAHSNTVPESPAH